MIDIDIPYTPVIQALRQLVASLDDRHELMGVLAGTMHRAIEDNFAEGGRPDKWVELAASTQASRRAAGTWPGQILVRSGQLAASIQAEWDQDHAAVGTNKAYAAIQQFGGQTRPHVIKPRFKRALKFGGVIVRQVNHPGSKIPARPFLTLTPDDEQAMLSDAEEFVAIRMRAVAPGTGSV